MLGPSQVGTVASVSLSDHHYCTSLLTPVPTHSVTRGSEVGWKEGLKNGLARRMATEANVQARLEAVIYISI